MNAITIILATIIIFHFLGAFRALIRAARLEAPIKIDLMRELKQTESRTAPTEATTYLYHYNGQLYADNIEQLKAHALKVAHDRGDFLKLETVSKQVNESGRRWRSHAYEEISQMTANELVNYIEGGNR